MPLILFLDGLRKGCKMRHYLKVILLSTVLSLALPTLANEPADVSPEDAVGQKTQCTKTIRDYTVASIVQTFCGVGVWYDISPKYELNPIKTQEFEQCTQILDEDETNEISKIASTFMLIGMQDEEGVRQLCTEYRDLFQDMFVNNQGQQK